MLPTTTAAAQTLAFITARFDLMDISVRRYPIEIPNVGRDYLPALFRDLGFKCGAEIGVERGEYTDVLSRENPDALIYAVDLWAPYLGYRDHVDGQKLQRFYDETCARFADRPNVTLVRKSSVYASQQFEDGELDFVYIDGNHSLPYVIADLAAWTSKVRAGGIVSGHDFLHHRWPNQMHVPQAIYAWTDAYDIKPWFVLGRKEKREGEIRDDGRSWMWVHEPRPAWRKGMGKPIKQ